MNDYTFPNAPMVPTQSAVFDDSALPPASELMTIPCPEERVYKSLWHLAIAAVGLYELKSKTGVGKFLAAGLIAFHVDAAVFDALGRPTTPQRLLKKLRRR